MIRTLGALVDAAAKADALRTDLQAGLHRIERSAAALPRRPRVYFEEWNEPLIAGIGWVSELITIAGGEDGFAEIAASPGAKGRIIAEPSEVIARAPDIVIGSWCGKRFRPEQVRARPGWEAIPAVRNGTCTRSSPATSCNRVRPRSATGCASCTRSCSAGPRRPLDRPGNAARDQPAGAPLLTRSARTGSTGAGTAPRRTHILRRRGHA